MREGEGGHLVGIYILYIGYFFLRLHVVSTPNPLETTGVIRIEARIIHPHKYPTQL